MRELSDYYRVPYAEIIEAEYNHIAGRGVAGVYQDCIPEIQFIVEEVGYTVSVEELHERVREAIMSGEHERRNMSKREFSDKAQRGLLEGYEIRRASMEEIIRQTFFHLDANNVSYIDYDGYYHNIPVKPLW